MFFSLTKGKKNSRAGGTKGLYALLLPLLLCFFLIGCDEENPYFTASRLYEAERYDEANEAFRLALSLPEYEHNTTVMLAYAYNQLAMGNNTGAEQSFVKVAEESTGVLGPVEFEAFDIALRELKKIYMLSGRTEEALEVYEKLYACSNDYDEKAELEYEISCIKEKLWYQDESHFNEWKKAIELIAMHENYAPDCYVKLYSEYKSKSLKREMLETADTLLIYLKARTSYIDDFEPIVSLFADAAKTAEYTDYENSPDYYYDAVDYFLNLAEEKNMSSDTLLKYKIVIAEKKGKFELAARLLGVYLNHCPDDKLAKKELNYLKNRLGIEDDTI